jgi:transcriptional regulator with XRE-family HTH domain
MEPLDPPLATGSRAPRSGPRAAGRTLESILGARIRAGRQALGLTAADLAARAGLSAGMLSKIEGGTISPSLGTIQALAQTLGVPLASLFAGVEERLDCSHVVAGAGLVIEGRGTKAGHRYELLGQPLRGELELEPYLITLTAEAEPYTAFQHDGIEFIYMLTGRVRYRHANQSYLLEPGDALFFDAGAPHGPAELLELPMTYLSIIAWPRHG